MLLCQFPGPDTGGEMFQRFGFTNTAEWIAKNRFNQIERAQCDSAVYLNPVAQILTKLWVKNRFALTWVDGPLLTGSRQARPRGAVP